MATVTYVPRIFGGTLVLYPPQPPQPITVTWVTRDMLATWTTRDDKASWNARDEKVTWKART